MVNGEICIGLFAIRDIKKVRSAADIYYEKFMRAQLLCLTCWFSCMSTCVACLLLVDIFECC